jgi:hypothetical protein
MARIEISSITGASPFNVYVSDVYGNNQVFVATINTTVPPVEYFYLPSLYDNAPAIMLTIVDGNGCSKFKILECRYGCGFAIQVVVADCIYNITIATSSCTFDVIAANPSCDLCLS